MYKILIVVLLLAGTISYVAAANLNQKVDICHLTGNGKAQLNSVTPGALSSHLRHGDVLPGDPVPGEDNKVFSESCEVIEAPILGPSITAGGSAFTEAAGVLWRGQGDEAEILIGIPDLNVSDNSNDVEKIWNNTIHRVTFNWDKGANAISSVIDGVAVVYFFDDETVQPLCLPADWDTMQLTLVDTAGASLPNVSVANLALNGFPLGDVSHDGTGAAAQKWTISDIDFTENFTLAADLSVVGFWDNADVTSVGVTVGCK